MNKINLRTLTKRRMNRTKKWPKVSQDSVEIEVAAKHIMCKLLAYSCSTSATPQSRCVHRSEELTDNIDYVFFLHV